MPERYSKIVYQFGAPWWVFEAVIWLGLVACGTVHIYAHLHGLTVLRLVSGIGAMVLVYGSFIEPRLITVKRFEVGKGERIITIAFLSDLHAGPYKKEGWFKRLVARVNALGADLTLLGGDYVLSSAHDARHLTPLAGLRASLGVFAMLGNHEDHYGGLDEIKGIFADAKITLLVNAAAPVPSRDLTIAAVDDDWYSETRFDLALKGVSPEDPLIMMVHNPEVAVHGLKEMTKKPALMLSGHDHGGQIRLPWLGSIAHMPHHLGRHFDRGLFIVDGVPLIIGQGVGESGPRARLFCPPQIVLVTLRY